MTDVSQPTAVNAPAPAGQPAPAASLRGLGALEVDLRLFGMVIALAIIVIGFNVVSNGRFLTPVNLINLTVQSVSVAIIATGMTLVIVSRNIDLSVGSVVGVVGMITVILMTDQLPAVLGLNHPLIWIIALVIAMVLGGLIGAFQGSIIAYIGVPSFIVTLGGLLAWRGVNWAMTRGVTVGPVDPTFRQIAGGPAGSIGGPASWAVGVIFCLALIGYLAYARRQRRKFGFRLRPLWAEIALGAAGCVIVLGLVFIANSYLWPEPLARQRGLTIPPGGIPAGIPWPIFLLIAVTLAVTFLATRLRFGRHVFAIGGNPDAAELAGINTRRTIMKTFILVGVLCGISAAVATARIDSATIDLGAGYELYVIAACVIGGTSFAGGIGTIPGSVLGAVVMASLAYGLSFIGLSGPIQDIVAGVVLVVAVGFDTVNRRRGG